MTEHTVVTGSRLGIANRMDTLLVVSQVVIVDSNLSNCVADTGGAVGLQDQATLRVSGSSFWNNTANRFGGVVVAGGQSRSVVKVSNFVSNHAGRDGATLYMTESAEVGVSSSIVFVCGGVLM